MSFSQKRREDKFLGRMLVERRVINEDQLNKVLAIRKEKDTPIGEILIEMGFARERDILAAVIKQYKLPYVPLDNYEPSLEALDLIPSDIARKYFFIPIDKMGRSLTIAMSNPFRSGGVLSKIEKISKLDVQVVISTRSEIINSINRNYRGSSFPSSMAYA